MLTQCPECQTVFRVMPEQLRAAAGRVRCGQCDTIFDALGNTEDEESAPSETDAGILAEDPGVIEEEAEEVEIEPAGDEAIEYAGDDDPLAITAEHELLDLEIESTPSIEITMEGERINIDGQDLPLSLREPEEIIPDLDLDAGDTSGERLGLPDLPVEVERFIPVEQTPQEREFFLPSGVRVAFEAAHQQASEAALPPVLEPRPRRRSGWLWGVGSALLTLAIAAQVVHFNRDALARNPVVGAALIDLYARLGMPLSPEWDLGAYELRQWGATADPNAGGALRVRVSLFNRADREQPYPLLRLTLQDRFGGQIGARDLTPAEYMKKPVEQMLTAGQRVDAQIEVVDPGKEAVGFELDVCLQQKGVGVVCANDRKQ